MAKPQSDSLNLYQIISIFLKQSYQPSIFHRIFKTSPQLLDIFWFFLWKHLYVEMYIAKFCIVLQQIGNNACLSKEIINSYLVLGLQKSLCIALATLYFEFETTAPSGT